MLRIKPAGKKSAKVVFELGPGERDHAVSVVGDFNGWDPYATPMKRKRDGSQRAKVKVAVGRSYQFKYLTDDGTWFCDPDTETEASPDGDLNSVLRIPAP